MTKLPLGWRRVRFGDAAETALGKMLDKGRSRGLPKVPYLRNINVQWGTIDLRSVLDMELADDERERFGLREGDLLVCEGGEIGRAAIWRGSTGYMAYQKALHRVRPHPDTDPSFLRYQLECLANDGSLARFSTGSTIAHLPQQALRAVRIALPGLEEQRRIVAILEEHLSDLSSGLANLASSKARLRSLRLRTLENLVPGGTPMNSLGNVTLASGYGTSAKCVAGGAGPAVVRIPNLVGGRVNLNDEKRVQDGRVDLSSYMLQPGDLLIVRTNGSKDLIGRSAVVQGGVSAAFASYLIRFRLDASQVRPEWARLMLERPSARAVLESLAASSAGQHNLSLGKLNPLEIPVPSLSAQSALMAAWAEQATPTDRLGETIDHAARRAKSLHRAVLAATLSGRLTGQGADTDLIEELAEEESA